MPAQNPASIQIVFFFGGKPILGEWGQHGTTFPGFLGNFSIFFSPLWSQMNQMVFFC